MCLQFAGLLFGVAGGGLLRLFTSVPVHSFPCCRYIGFSGLLLLRLLAGVVVALQPVSGCSSCGVVCLVCRWGSPAAVSLPWVGVLLAKVSPEFVGYDGCFGCPSWFFILFQCLMVHLLFLELGWFLVTRWWLLLRLLVLVSDARSHVPGASPLPLLPSLAVGWSWRLVFLVLCLGSVLLASRVGY